VSWCTNRIQWLGFRIEQRTIVCDLAEVMKIDAFEGQRQLISFRSNSATKRLAYRAQVSKVGQALGAETVDDNDQTNNIVQDASLRWSCFTFAQKSTIGGAFGSSHSLPYAVRHSAFRAVLSHSFYFCCCEQEPGPVCPSIFRTNSCSMCYRRSVKIVVRVGQNALMERKMQLCPVSGYV
jgi:hypothetical protein